MGEETKELKNLIHKDSKFFFVHVPKAGGSYVSACLGLDKNANSSLVIENKHFSRDPNHFSFHRLGDLDNGFSGKNNRNYVKDKIIFTTIRNPFNILVSMYKFGSKGAKARSFEAFVRDFCNLELCKKEHRELHDVKRLFGDNPLGLTKKIKEISKRGDSYPYHYNLRQNYFHQIFNDNNECMVDFIFRIEEIKKCLSVFNSVLCNYHKDTCINIIPHKINASPGVAWKKQGAKHGAEANIRMYERDKKYKTYHNWYTDDLVDLVNKKFEKELKFTGYNFNGYSGSPILFKKGIPIG